MLRQKKIQLDRMCVTRNLPIYSIWSMQCSRKFIALMFFFWKTGHILMTRSELSIVIFCPESVPIKCACQQYFIPVKDEGVIQLSVSLSIFSLCTFLYNGSIRVFLISEWFNVLLI